MKMITAWRIVGAALAFLTMVGFADMAIAEPTDAEGWKQLGTQQAERGELDAAGASLLMALKLYKDRGDLARAAEVYTMMLKLDEAAGHKRSTVGEYILQGQVYMKLGDLARAEEAYAMALKLAEVAGDKLEMAYVYFNLGPVYEARGDLAGVVEILVKAEKAVEGVEDVAGRKDVMAAVYAGLGIAYTMKGDMAKACPALRKARALYTELGKPQTVEDIADKLRGAECPAE
jgi:tetratricopeptide (TPR) repeat protein